MSIRPHRFTCAFLLVAAATIGCTPEAAPPVVGSSTTTSLPVPKADLAPEPPQEVAEQQAESADSSPASPDSGSRETSSADRGSNSEPERITFDDLNCGIQANLVFRDWMLSERAKELDGQRVRLAGYMLPDLKIKEIEEFVLLKNLECKFGPDGQADHLALIKLQDGVMAKFTDKPIDVIGTLHYKPFTGIDGFTWAIYEIEAEAVQPMRR